MTIKAILVMLSLILIVSVLHGQSRLEKAKEYKDNYQYANALALYTDLYENRTPRKTNDVRDIAHCYLMMNDLKSAQDWLSRINSLSVYTADDVKNYAFALKSMGYYDDAVVQFRKLAEVFPEKAEKVPEWIDECYDAQDWIKKPSSWRVKNAENLNSENSDFGLMPYKNGYIFSSDRKIPGKNYSGDEIFGWTGNPYLKLYSINYLEEDYTGSNPKYVEVINSNFHNGPGTFDNRTGEIYYTITTLKKEKLDVEINNDPTEFEITPETESYVNRLEIFSAKLVDGNWKDVKPFIFNNSDNYSVGHPAISNDGTILYFSSDMAGGFGQSDIWYSVRQSNGEWGKPVNAGDHINTEGKEGFPVIDEKGVLYFSSDGLPGMGGLDIFRAMGEKGNWSAPENLRFPMNSPKDDFSPYFIDGGVKGYLSSNRDGGRGEDDIYYFSKELVIVGITKTILPNNSIVPLEDVTVIVENKTKNKTTSGLSDDEGMFAQAAKCGEQFEITGTKIGYFVQSKELDAICTSNNDTLFVELILDKIVENKSYVLENIYYDYNKWNIRSDASVELDKLVKILVENPEIDIELGSHTDARGTFKYNEDLSQKRAESAVAYIISKGIDADRITAKGYGEYKLRNECADGFDCSEDAHQLNRRTEFTVTKIRTKN